MQARTHLRGFRRRRAAPPGLAGGLADAIQSRTFTGYTPIWTSALFGAVMLGAALAIFARRDF